MPDSYSAASRRVDRAARQEVVRRVAEARGWSEPAAAKFVNALLRLLHTVSPGSRQSRAAPGRSDAAAVRATSTPSRGSERFA
jgi:hypothetical protein